MVHQHSRQHKREKKESFEQKQKRLDLQRAILLIFSYHDPLNKEIVHTKKSEDKVYAKLKDVFGDGYSPVSAEYGEVLNRFGI